MDKFDKNKKNMKNELNWTWVDLERGWVKEDWGFCNYLSQFRINRERERERERENLGREKKKDFLYLGQ